MVLALVLLPALAGILGGDSGRVRLVNWVATIFLLTLTLTFGKVAVFLVLVLVVGTRVVPWLLSQVARTGSREPFTLSVLAAALVSPWIRRRCSKYPCAWRFFYRRRADVEPRQAAGLCRDPRCRKLSPALSASLAHRRQYAA